MLDFVLCGEADPEIFAALGEGLARGAELAGIEITGGEVAQVGEIVAGHELGRHLRRHRGARRDRHRGARSSPATR